MKYHSTRGVDLVSFKQVVLKGLAPDGGLYVPEDIPALLPKQGNFQELALQVFSLFIDAAEIPSTDLQQLIEESFSSPPYDTLEITPLSFSSIPIAQSGQEIRILELWHGPTFAFKDVALSFLGNLFGYFLRKDPPSKRLWVLGATSGDTGSAAIYGLRGKPLEVCILYPQGRVSPFQEFQMCSVPDENIHCVAVSEEGTFDDCQNIVKACFKKFDNLVAVNSINWARILAQICYYYFAFMKLRNEGKNRVRFVVPTGNFGNILAGYYFQRMLQAGGIINQVELLCGTNQNDIVHRFFQSSPPTYKVLGVQATHSPAMDICVSSNFERYLWLVLKSTNLEEKAEIMRSLMSELGQTGCFQLNPALLRADWKLSSAMATDAETVEMCQTCDEITKGAYVIDPHTAVGIVALKKFLPSSPSADDTVNVCLATAHPGKFQETLKFALGEERAQQQTELLKKKMPKDCQVPRQAMVISKHQLMNKMTELLQSP